MVPTRAGDRPLMVRGLGERHRTNWQVVLLMENRVRRPSQGEERDTAAKQAHLWASAAGLRKSLQSIVPRSSSTFQATFYVLSQDKVVVSHGLQRHTTLP